MERNSSKKPTQRKDPVKSETGEWIRTDEEKADKFKDHLSEVFSPYSDNIDQEHVRRLEQFISCPLPISFIHS